MLNQVYPGKPIERHQSDLQSGTPVAAVAGSTTGGIDFALIQGGSISGVVTEAATGEPVRGVRIEVRSPSAMSYGVTDPSGSYSVAGLRTGSYRVTARPAWEGILSFGMKHALFLESLLGQVYVARGAVGAEREAGTPVVVTAPAAVTGIDFALVKGGVISGTVTNARTGEPMARVGVVVSGARHSVQVGSDERGRYEATGLPAGAYTLRTFADASGTLQPRPRVLDQVYKGIECWKDECRGVSGTPVPVSAGRTIGNIDFALAEGGAIAGTVTDAVTGAPVKLSRIEFFSPDGRQADAASVDAQGRYASGGLRAGTYFAVAAANWAGRNPLARQLYKGRPCAAGACDVTDGTPITVTAATTTSGIDFALTRGGTISGTVTNRSTGQPVPGAEVGVYASLGDLGTVATVRADEKGAYAIPGLDAGDYYVQASAHEVLDATTRVPMFPAILDQIYPDVACAFRGCREVLRLGKPVAVKAGATATGIDFALGSGGTISGRITDAATGKGVKDVRLIFHLESGVVATRTVTDADGNYTSLPLPTGAYYLRSQAPEDVPLVGVLYPNVPYRLGNLSVTTGTPVLVSAGGTVTGKDFSLAPGGFIQGKVTDKTTGGPVQDFFVKVYTSDGVFAASSGPYHASPGTYATPALPPGTYHVRTEWIAGPRPPGALPEKGARPQDHLVDEAFGGVPCPQERCKPTAGTPVVVRGPGVTSGIDFALKRSPGPAPSRPTLPSKELVASPASGPASGGGLLEIAGSGFEEGATTVRIGGRLAPSIDCQWSLIKVVVPPGAPGPADVVVTRSSGSVVLPKGYRYVADQPGAPQRR